MEGLFAPSHLIVLLVIVLLLFGGKKIPELMRGVGQGVGELQKGLNDAKSKLNTPLDQDNEPKAIESKEKVAVTKKESDTADV